ncbi:MAG: hypothetical protein GQ574_22710 [Crocinitomix sp.]|nr:hypothetical protein [Crocinitomix sp.]
MRIWLLKLISFCVVMLMANGGSAQSYKPKGEVGLNFPIEKILEGSWDLDEAKVEIISLRDSNLTVAKEDSIHHLYFLGNMCIYEEYEGYRSFFSIYPRLRNYRINKDSGNNKLELIILDSGDVAVRQSFEIMEYSFNRLVLAKYNLAQQEHGYYSKTVLTYKRQEDRERIESLGTWFHHGSFDIFNLEDADTLKHHFVRVAEDQNIRDSVAFGKLSFQLDLWMNETYVSFCTTGNLGTMNLGDCRIDLLNKRLYFFECDRLVYDYYFSSNNELVLKLNQSLSAGFD